MPGSTPSGEVGGERLSRQRALSSLFLVSLFSISFETFLTRYFAVALFSQYSYWIISIAMLGYSVSGVLLSLFEGFFRRRRAEISLLVPVALIAFTVAAFAVLRSNPFNPLEFQNETLWRGQIAFVLLYYLGLFPVFFFSGLFVGMSFLHFYREMGRIYAVDLFGAAGGALAVLGLMFLLHPYHLPAAMLAVLFIVFLLTAQGWFRGPGSWRVVGAAVVVLAGTVSGALWVTRVSPLSVPDFKPLHATLNIAGHSIRQSVLSPSGSYLVMDDYTERNDLPMTNDYSLLKIGSPPKSYGIYIDAQRVAPLLRDRPHDMSYVQGALSSFPYAIRRNPRVLILGTNGGFKVLESEQAGARGIVAVEQRRVLHALVSGALREADPGLLDSGAVRLVHGSVFSALRGSREKYDLIEVGSDYLAQDSEAGYAFTREAVRFCLGALAPGGILSIPVDISELNVFALKTLNTVRAALMDQGVKHPGAYVMAYRTAWTCQILVSNSPFSASDIRSLREWCRQRSFDTPYYPGIDPSTVSVWNELAPVSFDDEPVEASPSSRDAIMDQMTAALKDMPRPPRDAAWFNLAPASLDRPDFYAVSRLSKLSVLLSHVSLLPVQEVGYLLNVFVLAQAVVLGMVVLLVPAVVLRRTIRARGPSGRMLARTLLYFGFLGLGYLFIELAFIQKLSPFLGSATTSFAMTLSGMLVFSGLGSWSSQRLSTSPRRGLLQSLPIIAAGVVFMAFVLDPLLLAAVGLPEAVKVLIAAAVIAPISFALGRPFPLGNTAVGNRAAHLVPWAWAVNGAFSVVSTPLANMISTAFGWKVVLAAAFVLYILTLPAFPGREQRPGVA